MAPTSSLKVKSLHCVIRLMTATYQEAVYCLITNQLSQEHSRVCQINDNSLQCRPYMQKSVWRISWIWYCMVPSKSYRKYLIPVQVQRKIQDYIQQHPNKFIVHKDEGSNESFSTPEMGSTIWISTLIKILLKYVL